MFTDDLFEKLNTLLPKYDIEQVFIITDSNVANTALLHWWDRLNDYSEKLLSILQAHTLILPAGEAHKTLESVCRIWEFLMDNGATRKAVVFNIGGGVITDIGGFAAATYKRGIDYIQVPTTLLCMIDAAYGGKTGFNYHVAKNSIGVIREPLAIWYHLPFLRTLPDEQWLSGYAEMLKHTLIADRMEFQNLLAMEPDKNSITHPEEWKEHIRRSVEIKQYVVEQDPEDMGMRHVLNFGHTVGHALEEYMLSQNQPKPHGYCILWGMVAELYLSHLKLGFPPEIVSQLAHCMLENYGKIPFSCKDYHKLMDIMRHDKKNTDGEINFTLLRNIADPRINQHATDTEIQEALEYLFTL